jgi:hypothetical protein
MNPNFRMFWQRSHHRPTHNNQHLDKMQLQGIGIALDLQCPKSKDTTKRIVHCELKCGVRAKVGRCVYVCERELHLKNTCIVTNLSSTITSFVKKSAPIVALY